MVVADPHYHQSPRIAGWENTLRPVVAIDRRPFGAVEAE